SNYRTALLHAVTDRFLGGRGTAWVRYEPQIVTQDDEISDEVDAEPQERIEWESTPVDYVHYRDFGHSVARTWDEVTSVWRIVYLKRPQLVERFGEETGNQIPLDSSPEDPNNKNSMKTSNTAARIYEIWDKESRTVVWISKSYPTVLDSMDDPLELEEFFPCPRPLYATLTSDTLVPVPDFALYQDQAAELDLLTERIDGLVKMLKVMGMYDASVPELQRLLTEGTNGDLIPVTNWSAFSEKQGLNGSISILPIDIIATALAQCYTARENIKNEIYEITGLSDILRGASQAVETATAQLLKGNFATLRLSSTQEEVARFATELLQIKAQIMCRQYQSETLLELSGAAMLNPADQQM
ncbi:MAG: molecular chaperone, partial [Pseudomonadota bacterium]|nr:molecular chaperone [Pseudomonadota bacterium]